MSQSSIALRLAGLVLRVGNAIRHRVATAETTARLGRAGRNMVFDPMQTRFATPATIFVGDDCFFNIGLVVSGRVRFGDRILIGPNVSIMSGKHLFGIPERSIHRLRYSLENPEFLAQITIEDEVWIGARAVVVGGLTIGMGSVIGAGSVVLSDVPPYCVSVGTPARPVRQIFRDEVLVRHLRALGYTDEVAQATLARRRAAIGDRALPTIDNSDVYRAYYYDGKLVRT